MAFDFPAAPTNGQVYSPSGGPDYIFSTATGAWEIKTSGSNSAFVAKAGDTMSGNLGITTGGATQIGLSGVTQAALLLDSSGATGNTQVVGYKAGKTRWSIELGNSIANSGADVGSNFAIGRFHDDGTYINTPLSIDRKTGKTTISNDLDVTGASTFTGWLVGVNASLTAQFYVNGNITAGAAGTSGAYHFGNTGTKYINFDGANFYINGGPCVFSHAATFQTTGQGFAGAYYDSTSGPAKFFAGTESASDVWRVYTAAAGNSLIVNQNGNVSAPANFSCASLSASFAQVSGNNGNPLQVIAAQGYNSLISTTVSGVSSWSFGTASDNRFCFQATSYSVWAAFINVDGGWDFNAHVLYNVSNLVTTGTIQTLGYRCRYGTSGGLGTNNFNLYWDNTYMKVLVDAVDVGAIQMVSDYRTKKDVTDLDSTWTAVKNLRPIQYTHAEFMPPAQAADIAEKKAAAKDAAAKVDADAPPPVSPSLDTINEEPLFKNGDITQWGFIAHELQAALIPSAASGVKDSPTIVQSPNPMAVLAAVTKALQEAMARIEVLEGKLAAT